MFVFYGRGEFGYVNGQIKEAQSNGTICGKCETDTTWFSGVAVDQQMIPFRWFAKRQQLERMHLSLAGWSSKSSLKLLSKSQEPSLKEQSSSFLSLRTLTPLEFSTAIYDLMETYLYLESPHALSSVSLHLLTFWIKVQESIHQFQLVVVEISCILWIATSPPLNVTSSNNLQLKLSFSIGLVEVWKLVPETQVYTIPH